MREVARRLGFSAVVVALPACNLEAALNADSASGSTGGSGDGDGSTGATSADSVDSTAGTAMCGGRLVRVVTHNVESIGAAGSESFDALGSTILRLDPDVACFQEVQYYEGPALSALATEAGYAYSVQADRSPAIGGDHTNACIAKVPLTVVGSWGGRDLSPDPEANDVGRDILAVRAYVGVADADECHLGVITLHLKSGQEEIDWFRRQVEVIRVGQAIDRYRQMYPDDPIAVIGDFNESFDDPALGSEMNLPAGLPGSYQLGSDIVPPLSYQPFATMQDFGFALADPTQEDSTTLHDTWNDSVRLDYVWYRGADLLDDEVYNSCRDDGVDEDPPGNDIDKSGEPLPCGVSTLASDHFPIAADFALD